MSTNNTVGSSGKSTNNIIPEYAREYKREYQFIKGINKKFRYLAYFLQEESEYDDEGFKDHKLDSIMKDIKRFLRAQEKGKLKNISNLKFNYYDINNILEIKDDIYTYYDTIRDLYDWSKYNNDESVLSRYEIYKNDLELFLSKINFEIMVSDSDSDIPFTDSDSDDF